MLLENCSPVSMISIPEHCTLEGTVALLSVKTAASQHWRALLQSKGQRWKDEKKKSHFERRTQWEEISLFFINH